jgi:hypothetical protein
MTQRQSNNRWTGGIASYTTPNVPSEKKSWKSSRLDFWDQDGILPIDYLKKVELSTQSIIYHY